MKKLIKSKEAAGPILVRSLDDASRVLPPLTHADGQLLAAQNRIAELEAALAEEVKRSKTLRPEIDRAFERGQAEGRQIGKREAESLETDRLARLEEAIKLSRGELSVALANAERLALLIARDSLDLLLGKPDYRSEILTGLIHHQLRQAGEAAVVEIRVSQEDFQDSSALAALDLAAGHGFALLTDPALSSGQCHMTLILGQAEIGLNQQWGAVRDLMTSMAAEVGP